MVAVERNAIAAEILECAVDKHCACDCSLPRTTYRLLYKDGQLVENLPGSSDAFILEKHKLFIRKAYQKLVLMLTMQKVLDLFGDYLHIVFGSVIILDFTK